MTLVRRQRDGREQHVPDAAHSARGAHSIRVTGFSADETFTDGDKLTLTQIPEAASVAGRAPRGHECPRSGAPGGTGQPVRGTARPLAQASDKPDRTAQERHANGVTECGRVVGPGRAGVGRRCRSPWSRRAGRGCAARSTAARRSNLPARSTRSAARGAGRSAWRCRPNWRERSKSRGWCAHPDHFGRIDSLLNNAATPSPATWNGDEALR